MLENSATYPTISVVVLNYNSLAHLQYNLESLHQSEYPRDHLEIVLADNGSTDGSLDWVAAHYPTVRIVRNGANLGFAEGNTVGARAACGEWVAFLNPDTRVKPDWLTELIQLTLHNPDVVCVASRMLTWDGKAIDFADAALNFMGWGCQPGYGSRRLSDFERDKELLFACGGAMLIKRQVFLDAGGFDKDYFAYYEDVDLGWRLWLMGYRVALAARAIVHHRHHGSWSSVSDAKRWMLAERNTLFTVVKNYEDASLARALPASLLLTLQRAYLDVRPDLGQAPRSEPAAQTRVFGTRYHWSVVRQLLQERAYDQLARRAWDELGRRWQLLRTPSEPTAGQLARPVDGHFEIQAVTLSRLVAGRQVLRAFPSLMSKRYVVQSVRRRTDRQVFPLFQWALVSNFSDDQFIRAMQLVIARFELTRVFDVAGEPVGCTTELLDLSQQVSMALLNVMDRALTLSNVPEEGFAVGGPALQPVLWVPYKSVVILAEMNYLLWSLPAAPLESVLAWLLDGCQRISSAA